MILTKEQVEKYKICVKCMDEDCMEECDNCENSEVAHMKAVDLCETIMHLYVELDRRELAHEKARHEVEVERNSLKSHKPACYSPIYKNSDWCTYKVAYNDDEPTDNCKNCHWCEQGYEALGEVEAE
jgi:hypothetical protein